jgi:hypothetical protein
LSTISDGTIHNRCTIKTRPLLLWIIKIINLWLSIKFYESTYSIQSSDIWIISAMKNRNDVTISYVNPLKINKVNIIPRAKVPWMSCFGSIIRQGLPRLNSFGFIIHLKIYIIVINAWNVMVTVLFFKKGNGMV